MNTRFGTLRINALAGPPRPLLIARQRADVFGPAFDYFVGPEHVLAALAAGYRRKARAGLRLGLHFLCLVVVNSRRPPVASIVREARMYLRMSAFRVTYDNSNRGSAQAFRGRDVNAK